MLYAIIHDGQLVDRREADWETLPDYKKEARDERGDGGPTWRPLTFEGSGSVEATIIELDKVRIVRSTPPPAPITISDVRAEAQRRIVALMGARDLEHCIIKQLNANMRANELNDKRASGGQLTAEEETEAQILRDMAAAIKTVRVASDALEALDPIPEDYADNSRWPS